MDSVSTCGDFTKKLLLLLLLLLLGFHFSFHGGTRRYIDAQLNLAIKSTKVMHEGIVRPEDRRVGVVVSFNHLLAK